MCRNGKNVKKLNVLLRDTVTYSEQINVPRVVLMLAVIWLGSNKYKLDIASSGNFS